MFKLTVLSRVLVLLLLAHVAAGRSPGSQWDSVRMLAPGTGLRILAGNAKPEPADVIVGGIIGIADGNVGGLVWPTGGWRIVYQR
jgi:hypothetical protein